MRTLPLAASGMVAALVSLAGAWMVLPPRDAVDEEAPRVAATSGAPRPADRIGTRGLVPIEVDDELGALEVYVVTPSGSLHPPPPPGPRADAWDLVVRIVTPTTPAQTIDRFKFATNPDSAWVAWAARHPVRGDRWVLGINLAHAEETSRLTAALIHEYGHLIALAPDQVLDQGHACPTIRLPEGCAAPGGYLAKFQDAFWARYGRAAPGPANADLRAAQRLHRLQPDAFVSEYAAMNVVEDFAESFAAFVHLDGSPRGVFNGKLEFFADDPEMVAIRDRLRADLGATLGTFRAG